MNSGEVEEKHRASSAARKENTLLPKAKRPRESIQQRCYTQQFIAVKMRGFGLIESLVSITVAALIITLISALFIDVGKNTIQTKHRLRADRLVTESMEAVRSIRDQNFLSLENGPHGLTLSSGVWSLTDTPDTVDGLYTRTLTISDVARDNDDNIDPDGTEIDPRTKKVIITLGWESQIEGDQSISTELYIADWQAFEQVDSGSGQWTNGTHSQTETGDTGALILDSTVTGWETALHETSELFSTNFNADGYEIFAVGTKLYMVSKYQGGQNTFQIIDATDFENLSILGGTSLGSNISGNDVVVMENYAYVGTDSSNKELQIIDISNPNLPQIVVEYNLPGDKQIYQIDIQNNFLYLTREKNNDEEFFILDISNPLSPTEAGKMNFEESLFDVDVDGNIAYLATKASAKQLLVLNVSNPLSIQTIATREFNPGQEGRRVAYRNDRLYFGTKAGNDHEFNIIDVTTPASPTLLKHLSIDAEIRDLDLFGDFAYITTDDTSKAFRIIDITSDTNPTIEDEVELGNRVGNGVFADSRGVYVTSGSNETSLFIFSVPQRVYYPSGAFTSSGLNSGSDTTKWLTYHWEGETAPDTAVKVQLRFASTQANLNQATWSGPDGTNSTYYTEASQKVTVPAGVSGTRWMQYKLLLTSDGEWTPEVDSVRIQYAP